MIVCVRAREEIDRKGEKRRNVCAAGGDYSQRLKDSGDKRQS